MDNDLNNQLTDGDAVDGYSDTQNGNVSQPDPGNQAPEPLSPDERAKEEAEIKEEQKGEDAKSE